MKTMTAKDLTAAVADAINEDYTTIRVGCGPDDISMYNLRVIVDQYLSDIAGSWERTTAEMIAAVIEIVIQAEQDFADDIAAEA